MAEIVEVDRTLDAGPDTERVEVLADRCRVARPAARVGEDQVVVFPVATRETPDRELPRVVRRERSAELGAERHVADPGDALGGRVDGLARRLPRHMDKLPLPVDVSPA